MEEYDAFFFCLAALFCFTSGIVSSNWVCHVMKGSVRSVMGPLDVRHCLGAVKIKVKSGQCPLIFHCGDASWK